MIIFWCTGSLLEAWESADPTQKSALVTQITNTLLTIDRDTAQALRHKDEAVPSAYERVFGMMHHSKNVWQSLSVRGSRPLGTAGSGPVGPAAALIPSNSSQV